jgi:hypothetical protein
MKLEKTIPDGAQILAADAILEGNLPPDLHSHAGRLS